ncbi:TldD/PmbA family protein [Altererythrobacter sp. MF3-039]|uniref:TldD/PmbA family protein n=1 Tax=Altererythrobacter sp. MF3-039 TaxID=3252901 RepID=UPI00390CB991
MIDSQTALDRCAQLLDAARAAGADAADAVASAESSEGISVRLGKLEDVERSEGEDIGLRVFVGRRSASVNTSDFSKAAFTELAERAVAMARLAPEDPYAGLVGVEDLAGSGIDAAALDLDDTGEPSPESLRERAIAAEDVARATPGITNSQVSAASFGRSVMALATSNGFSGSYSGSSHALYCAVIAGEGGDMQTDSEYRVARHFEDLPDPEEIGRIAGERTVAKLNPASMPSSKMPVIFDRRMGGSLIGHLIGAMSGSSVARKGSFLLGHEDEELFAKGIRIVEDPHKLRGVRSRPFDGEGVATRKRALVESGKITGWLTNYASAQQLGIGLTGHAGRGSGGAPGISVSNIDLIPGSISRDAMIGAIDDGVLVTEMVGMGVNEVTGDYSRGAGGFRIRNGEIAEPVAEFTVAGNLLEMFAAITAADDLEDYRGINVPTLRIDGMTVAGDG